MGNTIWNFRCKDVYDCASKEERARIRSARAARKKQKETRRAARTANKLSKESRKKPSSNIDTNDSSYISSLKNYIGKLQQQIDYVQGLIAKAEIYTKRTRRQSFVANKYGEAKQYYESQ